MSGKTILAALLVMPCMVLAMHPSPVRAIGQVTEPITITGALRGEKYQEELTVINTEGVSIKADLSADGALGSWAAFYSAGDLSTSTKQLSLAPNERRNVLVIFSVPNDAPNGVYTGNVSVVRAPGDQESVNSPAVAVSQKINRQVTIDVTDEEHVALDASLIPMTYNIASGEQLALRIVQDNLGNISIKPDVRIRIVRND